MKQRLGIAAALVARPELIILDEPTNGMDPAGIQEIRNLVRALAEEDGLTVILSSHLLDEVQRSCDRVAILNRGKLAAAGSLDDLLGGRERLRIEAEPLDRALAIAAGGATVEAGALYVTIPRAEAPALLAALSSGGVRLFEARWERSDLEAIFFAQTEAA
jgi:ABC-2 type transport system ATP-binding protein